MTHRNQAALCHVLGFCGFVLPFGHILAPFIWWLVRRDESPYVDVVGKEVINFQLSMTLYYSVSFLLCLLLIGFVFLLLLMLVHIFCMIKATIRALNEDAYYYPMTIRFLR
jgi:uncharacterized protein